MLLDSAPPPHFEAMQMECNAVLCFPSSVCAVHSHTLGGAAYIHRQRSVYVLQMVSVENHDA